jgi:hypothetical protein
VARDPHLRRRVVRRRRAVAALGVVALAAVVVLLTAGGGTPPRGKTGPPTTTAVLRPVRGAHTPSPGSLPQTSAVPSGSTRQFAAEMAALWSGVVHDSTAHALPAFFPEGAYAQLKAISDPAADWRGRLVHDFGLDIGAAHALLGAGAARARLLAVHVVSSYGHWITPGVCANRLGYYELPNARVVYRSGGAVRSFGIASMISWRGVWYVVHFGAILRASDVGAVDDPSSGAGVSLYSGTC